MSIQSSPTGELAVSTTGVFLSATNLTPTGPPAVGEFRVRNQTGSLLAIRVRVLPSVADLDALLRVRVEGANQVVFEGALGQLRAWSDKAFDVRPGQQQTLRVRTWIPPEVKEGYRGRIADIGLEMRAEPIRP